MIKLFGSYTSPFVRHCRIALLESALDFEFVETDAAASAEQSPMQKVPFLSYEQGGREIQLTDSSAILKYIREQSGQEFIADVEQFNTYCSANTLLDTAINLFYLEKDGVTPENSAYLARQQSRLTTGLENLNSISFSSAEPFNDADLRVGCLLAWGLFRQRFTLDAYTNLQAHLDRVGQYSVFVETAPPA